MGGSDLSESPSALSESCSEGSTAGGCAMSSVATAQSLTRGLAVTLSPNGNWKDQVSAIYRELIRPDFPIRLEKLTWNRVKSWLYGEARVIAWEEMRALEELRAIEEARRETREFAAFTNRLAIALAREGASLNRKQMAVLERITSRSAALSRDPDARPGIARRYVAVPGREAA